MDIKVDCAVYPWVEDDSLMVDVSFNEVDWYTEKMSLISLFNDFLEAHRIYGKNDFRIDGQKQVMHMIATLRYIARQMETELEGARI